MKWVRKAMISTLGFRGYLGVTSKTYLCLVRNGFLKSKYPELFFLKQIVKPGYTCIDIGANVGYYSYFLARYAGPQGELHAVEPIPMFGDRWLKNVKPGKQANCHLHRCALGSSEGSIRMGTPVVNGIAHHGMTKVVGDSDTNIMQYFEVPMKVPDALFSGLSKVDFIKCDVEGYEQHVFANLTETLKKSKPLVQSELGGDENRKNVITLFESLGYTTHKLTPKGLVKVSEEEKKTQHSDFYFVPEGNEYSSLICINK